MSVTLRKSGERALCTWFITSKSGSSTQTGSLTPSGTGWSFWR